MIPTGGSKDGTLATGGGARFPAYCGPRGCRPDKKQNRPRRESIPPRAVNSQAAALGNDSPPLDSAVVGFVSGLFVRVFFYH